MQSLTKSFIVRRNRRRFNLSKWLKRLHNEIMPLRQIIRLPHPRNNQRLLGNCVNKSSPSIVAQACTSCADWRGDVIPIMTVMTILFRMS